MPLTAQEERVIRLVLPTLDAVIGAKWQPPDGSTLAERYPWKPTPECMVTNGVTTAAIEVKRLVGDAATRAYSTSNESLFRRLVPSYGGSYSLWPCPGFRLPMPPPLIPRVKRELERVGKTIRPGGEGAIRISRSGEMTCISKSDGPFVNCWHAHRTDEVVREIGNSVTGIYYFNDGDAANRWHHSFITDAARRDFQTSLIEACHRSEKGQPAAVEWEEEWKLTRFATSTRDGVHVSAMHFGWAEPGLREELQEALDKAAVKFRERWAENHVVILERIGYSNAVAEDAKRVFPTLNLPANIDLVLLVDGDCVTTLADASAAGRTIASSGTKLIVT
ncbi:MAG: hypothetical protein WEE64_11965 [Dehalococcoidia bacterium]